MPVAQGNRDRIAELERELADHQERAFKLRLKRIFRSSAGKNRPIKASKYKQKSPRVRGNDQTIIHVSRWIDTQRTF
jgi:hypothetical protein